MILHRLERPSYGSSHYSPKELGQSQDDTLRELLQHGDFKSLFFYHIVMMLGLPLLGLTTPRRGRTRYVRPSVFALILGISVNILLNRRARIGGNGYIIGIFTAWWLLWSAILLVFTDVENDFQRIERVVVDEKRVILRWQSYPVGLLHWIDWCLGLFISLRGLEWN
ncbi:uncharacterized protein N7483_008283 [Penicillium malachiteum]|uniref:uncharacterized protein n=1 Tax=Penicillium malachiteum TaxID=1324776 RepID=UPI002546FE4E|nr:uncharacterized protein N7483_008283 [Penicillium malachiteum]KAJ5720349.1 hypothetical protein N7483_008283 [Penicillium malachiteum]